MLVLGVHALISLARLAILVTDMSVMTMSAQELTTPTSLWACRGKDLRDEGFDEGALVAMRV